MMSLKVDEARVNPLATALTSRFDVSHPCQLTTTTLVYVTFWEKVTFHRIYHFWFTAIVYAIFISDAKVVVKIVELFTTTYAAPPAKVVPTANQRMSEAPLPFLPALLPFAFPSTAAMTSSEADSSTAALQATKPVDKPPLDIDYVPGFDRGRISAPNPTIESTKSQTKRDVDPYMEAQNSSSIAVLAANWTIKHGKLAFLLKDDVERKRCLEQFSRAESRAKRVLSSDDVSTKIIDRETEWGGNPGDTKIFTFIEYTFKKTSPDTFDDAVGGYFDPPGREDDSLLKRFAGLTAGADVQKMLNRLVGMAEGFNDIGKMVLLCPFGMPLDLQSRKKAVETARRKCAKTAKTLEKQPITSGGSRTIIGQLTPDDIQSIMLASIATGGFPHDRMLFQQDEHSKNWVVAYFPLPGDGRREGAEELRNWLVAQLRNFSTGR
ncbi:MAG: hypothetical protein LBD72_01545 [Puniceicoccales bacterium]|jgi:hypothetical protein|nr:hypothetical protein [Puniceicoccales bacterium]